MLDIEWNLLNKFDVDYKKDKNNKIIENAIKNVGIDRVCLNADIVNKTQDIFNIELPKSKIYNQGSSLRCWIFAGVNLIKNNVASNLNVQESEYALSVNYLSFLDKLEKSNLLYNRIIENDNFNFEKEVREEYLKLGVYEGGYFECFRALINKYGIVPDVVMPDVKSSKLSNKLIVLFRDKVKKDLFKLIDLKKSNMTKEYLNKKKEEMLYENYNLLSKCLGELPIKFDYEYKDKNGNCVKLSNISPLDFKDKYLTMDLNSLC